ncbi:HdeD family acid-resistance protein [Streptomyces apocyni]|uniref:HdeD family acid-resistance protein n=1 Tax=Streptomyces apocyni TaxID=2654677 RepID=UPI0012E9D767|nr:HdeD family acid-resistance protein [Streptomyces apocyni]
MARRTGPGAKLSRGFGRLTLLGVILALAGLVGLGYAAFATLTSMLLFGWLLLAGGVVGLLHALQSRGSSFFWLGVVVAALNLAAGVVLIKHPESSAQALTMFAALLFLTGGAFRLVGSAVVRGTQFGLTLAQGAFGLMLGILVLFDLPNSSRYVIGTFFSLALLFDGLGLIAAGVLGRRVVTLVAEEAQASAEATDEATDEAADEETADSEGADSEGIEPVKPPKSAQDDQNESST